MKPLLKSVIFLFFLISCSLDKEYSFQESQSDIVQKFRKEGYYEYNSKFNDVLMAELNGIDNEVLSPSMLETIETLSEKIKNEKNAIGCYLIEWENCKDASEDRNFITLEWNTKYGVIVRMFTKSSAIKQQLPHSSY
ncbi:hypothetical protein ACI6PS_10280 [Flavobacterium sp. PLA-1-15]|uniref:hypothetical protein n=1 Tax=Flavobacterium sp. PLA-1-15 TaxID=3380533 RepID=UPI003B80938A